MRLTGQFTKIGTVTPTISKAAGKQLRFYRQLTDTTTTGVYALVDEDGVVVYIGASDRAIAERMKLSVSPGQGLYPKLANWEGRTLEVMQCLTGETVAALIARLEPATNRPIGMPKVKATPAAKPAAKTSAKAKAQAKAAPVPVAKARRGRKVTTEPAAVVEDAA